MTNPSPALQPQRLCSEAKLRFPQAQLAFLLLWWMGFLIYPLWYLPNAESLRPWICAGLFLGLVLCSLTIRYLLCARLQSSSITQYPVNDHGFFLSVLGGTFLLHLPFLNLPILSGLDTIDHAAIPAVLADRITRLSAELFGFSIQPFAAVFFVLLFLGYAGSPAFREKLLNVWRSIALVSMTHYGKTLGVLALITLVYAGLLLRTSLPDQVGDLDPIFRYPPLSKLILVPLYCVFGLHEWVGRLLQLLFCFAGSVYIYRLTLLFGSRQSARSACCLFLLLPPIFHYGNTHMIEGGLLFFVVATFFYWIRYLEKQYPVDLIAGMLLCTCACLYKHPAVSLAPAFFLMLVVDAIGSSNKRKFRDLIPSLVACAIPTLTMVLYMKLSSFNQDVPSQLGFPTPSRLWTNIAVIPQGVTWPVAIIFLVGLLALGFRKKTRRPFLFMMCWILPHYILTCMSSVVSNVRQALPYYLALIVAGALLVDGINWNKQHLFRRGLLGLISIFLLWACLFQDRRQDFRLVGRAMGDRSYVNFSNWNQSYLPYEQVCRFLAQQSKAGDKIYAPMANEPVHFYLSRYNLYDRIYVRQFWQPTSKQTLSSLETYCHDSGMQWLLVPRGKWLHPYADLRWVEQLFIQPPESFQAIKIFSYGTQQIGLWKISPTSPPKRVM